MRRFGFSHGSKKVRIESKAERRRRCAAQHEREREGEKRERQREERGWTDRDHLQSERVFWGLEIELGITALHASMDVVLSCIGASAKRRDLYRKGSSSVIIM